MVDLKLKYVRYIGDEPLYEKDRAYSLIGFDSGAYRVWTDLYEDALMYSDNEIESIPEDELKNYKLDPIKTYRDLYEQDFQESSDGLTEEDCKYYFLKDVSKSGKRPWYRQEIKPLSDEETNIIIYKTLTYTYTCIKQGVQPNLYKAQELAKCENTHWVDIINSLVDDNLINLQIGLGITQKGANYLRDNSNMQKVKAFLGKAFIPILESAVLATKAL